MIENTEYSNTIISLQHHEKKQLIGIVFDEQTKMNVLALEKIDDSGRNNGRLPIWLYIS